jgi:hypothetical protein
MKPIRTDSHQHALSVHVATDQGTYHVGIDDGLDHVAYADIRPTATGVDLALELAAGHHSPHVPGRLIDAVFDIDVMKTARTLSATLPLGDVDLLNGLARHCVNVHTRAAGVAACSTQPFRIALARMRPPPGTTAPEPKFPLLC